MYSRGFLRREQETNGSRPLQGATLVLRPF
jgi:hypothetical protein